MTHFLLFCLLVTFFHKTSGDFADARRRQTSAPTAVSPGPLTQTASPSSNWMMHLSLMERAMKLAATTGTAPGGTIEIKHDGGLLSHDPVEISGDENKDLDDHDYGLNTHPSSLYQSVSHSPSAPLTPATTHLLPLKDVLSSVTDEMQAHSVDNVVMETWEQWGVVLNSSDSAPLAIGPSKNKSEKHSDSYAATGTGNGEATPQVLVGAGAAEDDWLIEASGDRLIPFESTVVQRRPSDNPTEVQVAVTTASSAVIRHLILSTVTKIPKSQLTRMSPANPGITAKSPDSQKAMTKHQWHNGKDVDSGQTQPTATPSLKFGGRAPGSFPRNDGACLEGWGPCVASSSPNGTALKWDELQHTLSFSWVLHVYGTAVLSLLLMGGALLCLLVHSCELCGRLVLADTLLALTGGLQATHFLLDPYGTRSFLPRPVILVFYNLPLPLLLWAQVALIAQVRGTLLPSALRHPLVAGAFAVLHCTTLLTTDLLSPMLPHATPILLQALSLSWGLGLCLGLLFHMLPRQHPSLWNSTGAVHGHSGRTLVSSALQGTLCCALQVHAAFWLYGLLGNWRRFSWTWWLVQIWARLLELAWAWTLLLLTSQGHKGEPQPEGVSSCWATLVNHLPKRSGGTETFLVELLPSKWSQHLLKNQSQQESSRVDISVACEKDLPPLATIDLDDVNGELANEDKKAGIDDSFSGSCLLALIEGQEHSLPTGEENLYTPYAVEPNQGVSQALSIQHELTDASHLLPFCSLTSNPSSSPQEVMAGTQSIDITLERLNPTHATAAHQTYTCSVDEAISAVGEGTTSCGHSAAGNCLQDSQLQRDALSLAVDDITHL